MNIKRFILQEILRLTEYSQNVVLWRCHFQCPLVWHWSGFNKSFRSYLMCFSRSRLALWRHIFLHIQGHLNVIFKFIPVFPEWGLAQRGIWICSHCSTWLSHFTMINHFILLSSHIHKTIHCPPPLRVCYTHTDKVSISTCLSLFFYHISVSILI